jgi:hypothetical protein
MGAAAIVQMLSQKLAKTYQENVDLIFINTCTSSSILKLQNEWTLSGMCTRTMVTTHQFDREEVLPPREWYYHLSNFLATGGDFCETMTTKYTCLSLLLNTYLRNSMTHGNSRYHD